MNKEIKEYFTKHQEVLRELLNNDPSLATKNIPEIFLKVPRNYELFTTKK